MPIWLIILGSALGGGVIILHSFSKTKETSEAMLDAYKKMLQDSLEVMENEEEDDEDASESETDEDKSAEQN